MTWIDQPYMMAATAESKHLLLIKPKTHKPQQNYKAFLRAINTFDLTADTVCILHYDEDLPCGDVLYQEGASATMNYQLETAYQLFNSNAFRRVAVGVGRIDPEYRYECLGDSILGMYNEKFRAYYLLNKFPPADYNLFKKNAETLVDKLLNKILQGNATNYL